MRINRRMIKRYHATHRTFRTTMAIEPGIFVPGTYTITFKKPVRRKEMRK